MRTTPAAKSVRAIDNAAIIDLIIQVGCLGLLLYWTFVLVAPFLTIIVWSVILAVVVYPAFAWMVRLGVPRLIAALLLTVFSLLVLLGPAAWLGLSLIDTVQSIAGRIDAGQLALPPPPAWVKTWPLVGNQIHSYWSLASTSFKGASLQALPELKPMRDYLLAFAGSSGIGMLKFVVAVALSGFLLLPGPSFVQTARQIFRHIVARQGDEFLDLAGATVRNLARGVIGIAVLQALLAGLGFLVAGVPAAGLLSFVILVFGIVQIDALVVLLPIVIWAWVTKDLTSALLFTAYFIPVGFANNILRPFVLAHGLKSPMLVILIGVVGGLLAHGVIGLFVGPVVLAIAWELLMSWTRQTRCDG
jgi:predicted PurR-regulated permease PerM